MDVGTIVCLKADLLEHIDWVKKTDHYDYLFTRVESIMNDLGLPPTSFNNKYGLTQEKLFQDLRLPCFVYAGASTRKDGRNRLRLLSHQGRKKVVFEDQILCSGKVSVGSKNFQRWIPVDSTSAAAIPLFLKDKDPKWNDKLQKKKVLQDKDFGLIAYDADKENYLRFQMRWAKSLVQVVPDDTNLDTYKDNARFVIGLPAVQKANGKFYSSGIGVGWIVEATATYDNMAHAHLNKYKNVQETIKKLNAQEGTYYVPMSYVKTHFQWDGDPYPQAGLAINWPVTGFLHLIIDYSPTEPNFI